MPPWWFANPMQLEEFKTALKEHAPRLRVIATDDELIARGIYELRDGEVLLDRYGVEIRYDKSSTMDRPIVRETGGRIRREKDFHVNEADGSCCLGVFDEWIVKMGDHSFSTFLAVPFRNFFLSQSHFQRTGEWPFDERAHGLPGMLQSYSELLGCSADTATVGRFLDFLKNEQPKGHWLCPCGSGERLRRCCRDRFRELSLRIDPKLAKRLLTNLKDLLARIGLRDPANTIIYRQH